MFHQTKFTFETVFALALETVLPAIDTRAAVARFRRAVVNDKSAVRISVTFAAFALVASDAVDANFPFGAYHVHAVVHVHVADFPLEAARALANELPPGPRYQRAVPVVLAGIHRARIELALAILIHEVFRAVAYVPVDPVDAGAAVLTRLRQAFVHVDLAIFTWRHRETCFIKS